MCTPCSVPPAMPPAETGGDETTPCSVFIHCRPAIPPRRPPLIVLFYSYPRSPVVVPPSVYCCSAGVRWRRRRLSKVWIFIYYIFLLFFAHRQRQCCVPAMRYIVIAPTQMVFTRTACPRVHVLPGLKRPRVIIVASWGFINIYLCDSIKNHSICDCVSQRAGRINVWKVNTLLTTNKKNHTRPTMHVRQQYN